MLIERLHKSVRKNQLTCMIDPDSLVLVPTSSLFTMLSDDKPASGEVISEDLQIVKM